MGLNTYLGKFFRFAKNPLPYFKVMVDFLLKIRSDVVSKVAPFSLLDDKYYLQYLFHKTFGYQLDLRNPQTFNEKLQWIKLYYRNSLFTKLADKYAVRSYVEEKIGTQYLPILYGIYEDPMNIQWDQLPGRFVIKATHGCHYNILCKDKSELDKAETKKQLNGWLNENYYEVASSREWQYKNIPPKIVIEEYLEGDKEKGLVDYKFWCFWGEPELITVHFDRFNDYKVAFLDENWKDSGIQFSKPRTNFIPEKPAHFEEMMLISRKLSEGIPHCRVDLYYFNNRIIFGEMTLCTGGGFDKFDSYESDLLFGKPFVLPLEIKN